MSHKSPRCLFGKCHLCGLVERDIAEIALTHWTWRAYQGLQLLTHLLTHLLAHLLTHLLTHFPRLTLTSWVLFTRIHGQAKAEDAAKKRPEPGVVRHDAA